MARDDAEYKRSYVDVLERVSDGVHIDVVPRRRRQKDRDHADERPRGTRSREPSKKDSRSRSKT